jgi:hypothetical protein
MTYVMLATLLPVSEPVVFLFLNVYPFSYLDVFINLLAPEFDI